jgi:hypothetical protein
MRNLLTCFISAVRKCTINFKGGLMNISVAILKIMDKFAGDKIDELFNKYLCDYGKLIGHEIITDGELKLKIRLSLLGEQNELTAEFSDIRMLKEGGDYYLKIGKIAIEREWMRRIAQDYLDGKFGNSLIKVPRKVGWFLSKVF